MKTLLCLLIVTASVHADPTTYIYTGQPMTYIEGTCPAPCNITGFFSVAAQIAPGLGPGAPFDMTADVTNFGFGLNGDETMFTGNGGGIHVEVTTLDYLPGTGALTSCFPVFCLWEVQVGGFDIMGSLVGGIINDGHETIDIPGLYAENLSDPGIWIDPPPTTIPEPDSAILLCAAVLFMVIAGILWQ